MFYLSFFGRYFVFLGPDVDKIAKGHRMWAMMSPVDFVQSKRFREEMKHEDKVYALASMTDEDLEAVFAEGF